MKPQTYTALIVEEPRKNEFTQTVTSASVADLPENEVLVRVAYSSLNYKDALSATGNRGVTRSYPHTPGIDAAGTVVDSTVDHVRKGEKVIVTSYDLGMNTPGGFGQYIRVPADWVVKLPAGLDLKQSMVWGTAGFTAGMSVNRLIEKIKPDQGPVLVTGATGGVGSLAAGILSHLGYTVHAVTGKKETGFLTALGVENIIERQAFLENTKPVMLKAQWAGVVDTVGGQVLATAIKSTMQDGIITCCGNVGGFDLPITVFPFILRGISLVGIDSQHCPMDIRVSVWEHLASDWKFPILENIYQEVNLAQLSNKIKEILKGAITGRTLVNLA